MASEIHSLLAPHRAAIDLALVGGVKMRARTAHPKSRGVRRTPLSICCLP